MTFWPVSSRKPFIFYGKRNAFFHFIYLFIIVVLFDGERGYLFHLNWNQDFLLYLSLPLNKIMLLITDKKMNKCSHVIRNIPVTQNGWWAKQIAHSRDICNPCEWMNVFMLIMRSKGRGVGVFLKGSGHQSLEWGEKNHQPW